MPSFLFLKREGARADCECVCARNTVAFTPEEIERFKTDSEFFWRARRTMDASLNVSFHQDS